MNSFIGWVGGKSQLSKTIVAAMPKHTCYTEVFGGAGWVLFKKPQKLSRVEVYNDLNSDLVNLFRIVRDDLERFFYRQYFLLASREEYQAYRQRYREGKFKDDIERAIAFYYLIKNSFGSRISSNSWAYGKTRPPKATDFARLAAVRERLKKVFVENKSFSDLIPRYDSPDTLFYCDPPYTMSKSGEHYQHCFSNEDHHELAEALRRIKGKFILSYDDAPLIRKLYKGFNIQNTEPVRYVTNNLPGSKPKSKIELLVMNF